MEEKRLGGKGGALQTAVTVWGTTGEGKTEKADFENFEIRATHDGVRELARVRFLSWNLGIGRGQVWMIILRLWGEEFDCLSHSAFLPTYSKAEVMSEPRLNNGLFGSEVAR